MEPEKKSNGALVGLIVIIIILVIGGAYLWQKNNNVLNKIDESSTEENVTNEDSSELDALEQDLGGTDTNIDVDVNSVN